MFEVMNTLKTLFSIALLMPILLSAEEKNNPACSSKCTALMHRLEKLDCSTVIREAADFLSDGYKLVAVIPRGASHSRNEMATLRKGLQSRAQTMLDCLTKHRDKKEFSDAMSAFTKADFAAEKLSETSEMPQHVQEMLVRDYEQATETVSNLRSR